MLTTDYGTLQDPHPPNMRCQMLPAESREFCPELYLLYYVNKAYMKSILLCIYIYMNVSHKGIYQCNYTVLLNLLLQC